jgi:hypothetical protein
MFDFRHLHTRDLAYIFLSCICTSCVKAFFWGPSLYNYTVVNAGINCDGSLFPFCQVYVVGSARSGQPWERYAGQCRPIPKLLPDGELAWCVAVMHHSSVEDILVVWFSWRAACELRKLNHRWPCTPCSRTFCWLGFFSQRTFSQVLQQCWVSTLCVPHRLLCVPSNVRCNVAARDCLEGGQWSQNCRWHTAMYS